MESALRVADAPPVEAAGVLREAGLWQEALVLEGPGVLTWAERFACRAISPALATYPHLWRNRLGPSAPPAVYARGDSSAQGGPFIGVVGSRAVSDEVWRFAFDVGAELVSMDYGLVSGGADGCDRAAWLGARSRGHFGVCLSASGLGFAAVTGGLDLSLSPWDQPFSVGAAMERNPLIFALAEATVVVHARLRAGGGWQGASEALRRRLGRVIVREDPDNPAHRALISLGAVPLVRPSDLADALTRISSCGQRELFRV